MSFVAALGAVGAAALGTIAYLKTPRPISTLGNKPIYHGTTKEWGPQAKEGEQVKVDGYLFFTENRRLAEAYARGAVFPSVPGSDVGTGTPLLYRFSPVDPDKTVYKRGLISGAPYFPHGTVLEVKELAKIREMTAPEKNAMDALALMRQGESGSF
jgi:hypothetical protein